MWHNLISAIALVLVLEGILPFLSPQTWKRTIQHMLNQNDKTLRVIGFISMLIGVIILTVVHKYF